MAPPSELAPPSERRGSGAPSGASLGAPSGSPSGASRFSRHWPLLLVLVLVMAVCLHFCLWKSGMFVDEIFSYGLSNSRYMPFIGNGSHDRIEEQLLTREDFFDYLAVTGSEPGFDVASVYYNQEQDVHPPLYYWLLNFCSSLARGHFSKWIGLSMNLILFPVLLILLYLLGLELFDRPWIAAIGAALYGLSHVGLSTMVMIRMYLLMTVFTVLLALLAVKELRHPSLKREAGIGLVIYLGLMTQYYFVFYAFFLCLTMVVVLLCRKNWRACLRFGLCAFIGVGLMLVSFPAIFTQMTGQRLGPESDALANLMNVSAWSRRLRYYFGQIRVGLPLAVYTTVGCIAVWLVLALVRKDSRINRRDWLFLVLLVPVIPTVCVPAVISPVLEGRYIYNIMPICVLAPCFGLCALARHLEVRPVCGILLAAAVLCSLRTVPDYIYDEHRDYALTLEAHRSAPCLYLTEYFAGVTQDMLQLMLFDGVYVAGDPGSDTLAAWLKEQDAGELVVYIDIDSTWGSGFDADDMLDTILEDTGYGDPEHLYQYALSDTWLLTK